MISDRAPSRRIGRSGDGIFAAVAASTLASSAALAGPPPASAFGQTPGFSQVSMSPDGESLAIDRLTDKGHVVTLLRIGRAEPLRVVGVGEQNTLRALAWADARTALVDVSATVRIAGGAPAATTTEFFRTMAVKVDGSPPKMMLMDDPERSWVTGAELVGINRARPNLISMVAWDHTAAGQRGSVGTRLHNERRDSGWVSTLFDVDTSTGKGRVVDRGTAYTLQWLVDPAAHRSVARNGWPTRRSPACSAATEPAGGSCTACVEKTDSHWRARLRTAAHWSPSARTAAIVPGPGRCRWMAAQRQSSSKTRPQTSRQPSPTSRRVSWSASKSAG
jgi:hypothetical protein